MRGKAPGFDGVVDEQGPCPRGTVGPNLDSLQASKCAGTLHTGKVIQNFS